MTAGGAELEAMVTAIIDMASMPGRGREPQLAAELADVPRVDVPTPYATAVAAIVDFLERGP